MYGKKGKGGKRCPQGKKAGRQPAQQRRRSK